MCILPSFYANILNTAFPGWDVQDRAHATPSTPAVAEKQQCEDGYQASWSRGDHSRI